MSAEPKQALHVEPRGKYAGGGSSFSVSKLFRDISLCNHSHLVHQSNGKLRLFWTAIDERCAEASETTK